MLLILGGIVAFEAHSLEIISSCSRDKCKTYLGFKKCLASSSSPYAGFAQRPDQASSSLSFQAFRAFMTKHPYCYQNFCNEVCSGYTEEYQQSMEENEKFDPQKYEGRIKSIKNFCSQQNEDAGQFKFLCSFCAPYLKYGHTLINKCNYKYKKPPEAAAPAHAVPVTTAPPPSQQAAYNHPVNTANRLDLAKMTEAYDVSDSSDSSYDYRNSQERRKPRRRSYKESEGDYGYPPSYNRPARRPRANKSRGYSAFDNTSSSWSNYGNSSSTSSSDSFDSNPAMRGDSASSSASSFDID